MKKYAATWNEAGDRVRDIADGLPIYWGTGNPIREPHVVAFTKDAWSGEGMGYNVNVYPQGAAYRAPVVCHSVVIR